jgi:invasion protein IalB
VIERANNDEADNGENMPNSFRTLPLIALLAMSTALYAQETTQTDTQAEDTATEEAAQAGESTATEEAQTGETDPASNLDMGQEVQDPTYIKEQYGDWQLVCFRTEAGEDPCQMYQLLREDAGNPVAEFSLFKLPGNSQAVAGATITVPLGTLLPEGLKIAVDGGTAKAYNYTSCNIRGCIAQIGLTEGDITAYKAGAGAVLTIVPAQAPDQTVNIKASLNGFTAAYENLEAPQN